MYQIWFLQDTECLSGAHGGLISYQSFSQGLLGNILIVFHCRELCCRPVIVLIYLIEHPSMAPQKDGVSEEVTAWSNEAFTRLVAPLGPNPRWEQLVPLFRAQLHCSEFNPVSFQLTSPLWGQDFSCHLPWCLHPGTVPSFSKDQAPIPVHYTTIGKAFPGKPKNQNR